MVEEIKKLEMVENIGKRINGVYKIILDKQENGLWFRQKIDEIDYKIIWSSNSQAIYYIVKQ